MIVNSIYELLLIEDDEAAIAKWYEWFALFADQFELKEIPLDATESDKIRKVVEWMVEEELLPTVVVLPETHVNGYCPCCGNDMVKMKGDLVFAVTGYLENILPIQSLLNVLRSQFPLQSFLKRVQLHYEALLDDL